MFIVPHFLLQLGRGENRTPGGAPAAWVAVRAPSCTDEQPHTGSVKSAAVGAFTPRALASAASQGFPPESWLVTFPTATLQGAARLPFLQFVCFCTGPAFSFRLPLPLGDRWGGWGGGTCPWGCTAVTWLEMTQCQPTAGLVLKINAWTLSKTRPPGESWNTILYAANGGQSRWVLLTPKSGPASSPLLCSLGRLPGSGRFWGSWK